MACAVSCANSSRTLGMCARSTTIPIYWRTCRRCCRAPSPSQRTGCGCSASGGSTQLATRVTAASSLPSLPRALQCRSLVVTQLASSIAPHFTSSHHSARQQPCSASSASLRFASHHGTSPHNKLRHPLHSIVRGEACGCRAVEHWPSRRTSARHPPRRTLPPRISSFARLTSYYQVRAYVASERPALGQLYVLRKGMCVKNWRFLRAGRVWGDDMIIDSLRLMDHSQAVALTYIEVFALSRESMDTSCERFPAAGAVITRAAARIRLQRAILCYFCDINGTKPRSFIPQKHASGYFFVSPQVCARIRSARFLGCSCGGRSFAAGVL